MDVTLTFIAKSSNIYNMAHQNKNEQFREAPLVGVTGTFYSKRDDPRFELSLATSEAWQARGLPWVVVDGSPMSHENDNWVAAAHRERGAIVLRSEVNGIATQRQQGVKFAIANGGKNFLTQEPEKVPMVQFADDVVDALRANDIVVIGRTERAKESLPPVQMRTERLAGWILQNTLGLPADSLAGPRGYSLRGAEHLLDYPSDKPGMNNWIYMYHNPLAAKAAGQAVTGISVDLMHPASMVAEETGNEVFDRKRYEQFILQLDYLLKRDEVRPEALAIAKSVLDRINSLPDGPTINDYETMIGNIEGQMHEEGY